NYSDVHHGHKFGDKLGPTIDFTFRFIVSESVDIHHRQPPHTHFHQCTFHCVHLGGLHDGFNNFHTNALLSRNISQLRQGFIFTLPCPRPSYWTTRTPTRSGNTTNQ